MQNLMNGNHNDYSQQSNILNYMAFLLFSDAMLYVASDKVFASFSLSFTSIMAFGSPHQMHWFVSLINNIKQV